MLPWLSLSLDDQTASFQMRYGPAARVPEPSFYTAMSLIATPSLPRAAATGQSPFWSLSSGIWTMEQERTRRNAGLQISAWRAGQEQGPNRQLDIKQLVLQSICCLPASAAAQPDPWQSLSELLVGRGKAYLSVSALQVRSGRISSGQDEGPSSAAL